MFRIRFKDIPKRQWRTVSVGLTVFIFGSYLLFELLNNERSTLTEPAGPLKTGSRAYSKWDSNFIEKVKNATRHSWSAYVNCAWGKDIVHPVHCFGSKWMNTVLTMVDSLDTLWIMNLTMEFQEAKSWIATNLDFTTEGVNVFEVTIRILGGLLSAYTLSTDKMFLEKAINLGDKLLGAFNNSSDLPTTNIDLSTGKGMLRDRRRLSLSEVASIQLEFNELSRLTGKSIYARTAGKVFKHLHSLPKKNGLLPISIYYPSGVSEVSKITIGGQGDSYYEYLLKVWIQTGKALDYLRSDYEEAIKGIESSLMRHSSPNNLLFVGEIDVNGRFIPAMDHLVCFLPGTLAYGVIHNMPEAHLQLAEKLMRTCFEMYDQMDTKLAPERAQFYTNTNGPKDMIPVASANKLRPETMESLYYLYRVTKNPRYQLWGRTIMNAFDRYSKWFDGGYTELADVSNRHSSRIDNMDSYWLAETLKYAYLLFDQNAASQFPLNQWVFNTEAHPLPLASGPDSLLFNIYANFTDE